MLDMLPLSHAVCLLALSCLQGWLRLAIPCLRLILDDNMLVIFQKRPHKIKGFANKGCCKKNGKMNLLHGKWQRKVLITERSTMFQLSPLRKKKDLQSKKTYTYGPCGSVCPTCFRLVTFEIRRTARQADHTRDHQGWANVNCFRSFFFLGYSKTKEVPDCQGRNHSQISYVLFTKPWIFRKILFQ